MEHKTQHKFAIVYGSRLYVNVTNKYWHYLQQMLDRQTYIKYVSNMQVGSFPTRIVYHGCQYHGIVQRGKDPRNVLCKKKSVKRKMKAKKQIIFISEQPLDVNYSHPYNRALLLVSSPILTIHLLPFYFLKIFFSFYSNCFY